MAERGGFEPPVHLKAYDGLANRCFRPLSHLSRISAHNLPRAKVDVPLVYSGIATAQVYGTIKRFAPVAQLDRAFASGAKGQRFESSRAHHVFYHLQLAILLFFAYQIEGKRSIFLP